MTIARGQSRRSGAMAGFDQRLAYDPTRRIWVEADGGATFEYSDGDETERWLERVIAEASDVRLGSREIERGIRDFPSRYHLSATRANLLHPLRDVLRGRVLEVGAGCGALTRFLGENGGSIVALEGSARRATICRARCRDLENVEVVCADATRGLPASAYDTVLLVGVLEYAARYLRSPNPFRDFLRLCASGLDGDGMLVLAIENRLGLKYLAGAPEDHLGVAFAGVHDTYEDGGPATFGRAELDGLLRDVGFGCRQFLFPFPDYKFPQVVLSGAAFEEPSFAAADLVSNQGAENQSIPYTRTFAEESAWPSLLRNHLGPDLANSFLVVASKAPANHRFSPRLAYAYSSNWRRCFQKEAVLERDPGGPITVRRARFYPDEHVPPGPYRHRVDDERYVEGVLWGNRIYEIVNRDLWTTAQIADWARPWVELLVQHSQAGEDCALSDRTVDGGLLDCTPFNVVRTPEGTLVPFDQEWVADSPLHLGYLVFRGLSWALLRIRSTAAPADGTLDTVGSVVEAVMHQLGFFLEDGALGQFAETEAGLQAWVTGRSQDPSTLLASPMPPVRVPSTVDAGPELARLKRDVAGQTAWAQTSAGEVAKRDAIITALQASLSEQTQWAQANAAEVARREVAVAELEQKLRQHVEGARTSAAEVARRDTIIADLWRSVNEQTRWARASVAEVEKRDAMIVDLQASLSGQTRWAQASVAEVEKRDAMIADLQASLSKQVRAAQESAARVADQDGLIRELNGRLEESRQSLVEATRRDEGGLHRLEQEFGRQTTELTAHLDILQRRTDELVALSRRSIWERLGAEVSKPHIHALHPGWTEAGQRFNVDGGGTAHLRVEGDGFGAEATVFVAGTPLATSRLSDRLLSASVPDEFLRRPGVLAVWVDNGSGVRRRSAIRGFRVMSKRTVAAYGPARGRWRRVHGLLNWLVWLTSGVASRLHLLLFYLQRARGMTWTRAQAERAAQPCVEVLYPGWTEVGKGFNTQRDGQTSLGVAGSGFGNEAIVVMAGCPLDTHRASDRLLTAHVPDELFARPGVLSVWVDNRDGARRLSEIRCFRVMSKRTVAAYRPASGRWRRLSDAFNVGLRLTAGVWSRLQVPRLYLHRARGKRRAVSGVFPAAYPRREAPILTREMVAAHIKPTAHPRQPDVICFSIIDWDFRYQRPQQILSRLVESGHRVFYLSQRFLGPGDEAFRLRPLIPGVTEVFLRSPSALNIYKDAIDGEVEDALYTALLELKAAVGLGETICVVHLPFWTPLVLRLKADLGYRLVFDCLDDFSGFQNIGNRMSDLERTLAAAADRVAVSSRMLADKHAPHEPLLVPNAADYAHFAAASVEARRTGSPGPVRRAYEAVVDWCKAAARRLERPAPVLGYYGAIAHWFDVDLIAQAAAARPGWRFVLIGRTDPNVRAKLGAAPNIRLRAEMPYEDLPAHLAAFDVCLIPFVVDDLIKATNPVKFFEYLSAGKPVVAARMPELLPFAGECFLYEGLGEFLNQIERALAEKDDPVRVESRRTLAKANTWDMRVGVLRQALAGLYPRASVIVVTYGSLDLTQACVESLIEKTAYADWELIVVDNNSSDGTPEYLRSLAQRYPFVQIVLNDANRGFAAANNQGIRIATGEFIVLLNNDTVVTHGWLGSLLHHLDDPSVGMVGPVTNTVGNEAQVETDYQDLVEMEAFADRYTRAHLGRVFDIPMLAMFCVAMRRSLVDTVGMLDERYEVGMFEDDDFGRSVKALGYRIICAEDVFIHHVGRASFRKLAPETYQRIFDANRKRYEEKWGEPWVPHRYRPAEARSTLDAAGTPP